MRSLRSGDGTRIAWYDEPGSGPGPAVILSHGTGFNAGVWLPVARGLSSLSNRIVSIDHRNHGSSQGGLIPMSWWESARDLCSLAERCDGPVLGIGHSMGGAALSIAAASRPDLFGGLVLAEPIIIPPPFRRDLDHPIIAMTMRRKPVFATLDAARRSLTRVFAAWEPAALDGYLASALEPADGGLRLRCTPSQEVDTYRAGFASEVLEHLVRVDIPVLVLVGGKEDTYPTAWAEEFAARFMRGEVQVVPGSDHFLPMTHPEVVVDGYRRVTALLTRQ